MTNFEATKFDSTESISRIRQIGLQPNRAILATIIFQNGSGRKEEALLRGLREIAGKAVAPAWRLKFKGNEGWVYAPNRKFAGRMRRMLYSPPRRAPHQIA
jgi:hypothetical protein